MIQVYFKSVLSFFTKINFIIDVSAILKQGLDRSPAYESIKDVLQNLNADEVNNNL